MRRTVPLRRHRHRADHDRGAQHESPRRRGDPNRVDRQRRISLAPAVKQTRLTAPTSPAPPAPDRTVPATAPPRRSAARTRIESPARPSSGNAAAAPKTPMTHRARQPQHRHLVEPHRRRRPRQQPPLRGRRQRVGRDHHPRRVLMPHGHRQEDRHDEPQPRPVSPPPHENPRQHRARHRRPQRRQLPLASPPPTQSSSDPPRPPPPPAAAAASTRKPPRPPKRPPPAHRQARAATPRASATGVGRTSSDPSDVSIPVILPPRLRVPCLPSPRTAPIGRPTYAATVGMRVVPNHPRMHSCGPPIHGWGRE